MNIEQRNAIVLGGTSGIGLATAKRLAAAGARVTVASRDPDKCRAAAAELGEGAAGFTVDVLDLAALQSAFAERAPIDILVNAATGGERATGPFKDMDLQGFQGSFRKLWGYTNSVHAALPHLSDGAAIVLVSGAPARKCPPGYSAISTVGNAVEGFCRAVAVEIAPCRINCVSPGIIDTPMFPVEGDARAAFLAKATENYALARPGTADEVAMAIQFTIENDYVTGTTIDVDGGMLLP